MNNNIQVNNIWRRYLTSEESWSDLYDDCLSAKESIDLELYIFESDGVGNKFIELFKQKAKSGVKIRLLLDMIGSRSVFFSSAVEELQKAGVEIKFFNPAYIFRFNHFAENFFRTHRKIVIIDSNIVHIGGVNIAEAIRHWRDTHVRLLGVISKQSMASFEHMWSMANLKIFRRFIPEVSESDKFSLITNDPHITQRFLYKEIIKVLSNAQKSVYITTPYFVPSAKFMRTIRKLAKRGLDISLVVPHSSDHFWVDRAIDSYISKLLKMGVKVFRYNVKMLHAKTIIIDDNWATVGSCNFDNLSFFFNHEANVVTTDNSLVATLRYDFFNDVEKSNQIDDISWKKRSKFNRFIEFLTWPIHWLL